MTYYMFPYYAQSSDGLARVVFSDFNNFEVLKADDVKREQLSKMKTTRCCDAKDWFPAPCELDKNFFYEVINGKTICFNLMTDVSIRESNIIFGRKFIKTGRVFEL